MMRNGLRHWAVPAMRALLACGCLCLSASGPRAAQRPSAPSASEQFERALTAMDGRGGCEAAAPLFEQVAAAPDRVLAARALVYLGRCYERLGNDRARQAYRRVIEQFPEQRVAAAQARARLEALERTRSAARPTLVLRRLWNERPPADFDWAGPPSKDGRLVPMFEAQRGLVLMDITLLHHSPAVPLGQASDGLPACTVWNDVVLSPDAREAAFTCAVSGEEYELRVVRLDPRRPFQRRLAKGSFEPVEWRHRPEILAQVREGAGPVTLVFVSSADGKVRPVAALRAPVTYAATSPDGRWVAYDAPQVAAPLRRDVEVVPHDGGVAVAVGWPTSDDLFPAWTPDGLGLVIVSDRTGSPGLWLQPVTGGRATGTPRLLSPDLGRVAGAWGLTPDGGFIYFRQTGLVDVQIVDLDAAGMPAGSARPASSQVGAHMWAAWSPDGRRLAYASSPIGRRVQVISVLDLESGTEEVLPPVMGQVQHLRWSPDGRRLALRGRDGSARYGLYSVEVASGAVTPLRIVDRNAETSLGSCAWDVTGRSLLYHYDGRFMRVDSVTREEHAVDLLNQVHVVAPFSVLPSDGRIAFLRTDGGGPPVLTIARPDGSLSPVFTPEAGEQVGPPAWMPDGQSVIFTRSKTDRTLSREARIPSLWRADVQTGAVQPLGLSLEGLRDVWVSADGRHLAFTAGWPSLEPWVVEHFLPGAAHDRITR